MAAKNTISIAYKIEDADGEVQKVVADFDDFRQVIESAVTEANKLNEEIINISAVAAKIEAVNNCMGSMVSVMSNLQQAYSAQVEVETQLAVNMRNTMGAREEEIQSIKDLCAAQQELGVIGDEVQLAGAQQLATYLGQKSSLEQLIPAMNDMIAQQYGLNATQENAAQIASILGQVMEGQTGVLSRYGYSFNEVQEHILKYGTEAERAAVLTEVVESAVGGMNAELAKTDAGKQKQLENTLGNLKEQAGALAQKILPVVTGLAQVAIATDGIMKLLIAVKAITTAITEWHIGQKAVNLVIAATGIYSQKTALGLTMLQASAQGSQKSVFGLQIAMRGLLMASVVGAAIGGLILLISKLVSSNDDATDSTMKLIDAQERAKRDAEQLDQLRQQENSTLVNTRAELELNISKLKNFNGTKEEEKKLVNEMNDTYGESMGYFESVDKWYDALISNSEAYCKQMIIEARTRTLANQIAQKEQENYELKYDENGNERHLSEERVDFKVGTNPIDAYKFAKTQEKHKDLLFDTDGNMRPDAIKDGKIVGSSPEEMRKATIAANEKIIEGWNKQLQTAAEEAANITFSVKGSKNRPEDIDNPVWNDKPELIQDYENNIKILEQKREKATSKEEQLKIGKQIKGLQEKANNIRNGGSTSGNASKQEQTRLQQLNGLISDAKEEYVKASETEREEIRKNISSWKDECRTIEQLQKEAERPVELKSLQDIDDEIAYQQQLRRNASTENIASYDKEIKQLQDLRNQMEQEAHVDTPVEEIQTYSQLNAELSYYNKLLETASESERIEIQKRINEINELKETWDEALDDLKAPADISLLSTVKELDDAITYYQAKLKKASVDEIKNIQETIDAHERKRDAIQRGVEIVSMNREVKEVNSFEGKERKAKIQSIGFDGLTSKISGLKSMLNDTENPLTEGQREEIESLISVYEQWRKESVNTFDTVRKGWDSIKGIGSGVETLSDALEGNGNAWQTLTGIVDGFLQIYDGISAIVGIIDMLTMSSETLTLSKGGEAAATTVETQALNENTVATLTNTAAKSGESIAEAVKSGAKLPFPANIAAIAAGVAAVVGALSMIGSFATGGIVGGTSTTGDKLLARVNSGEMILNMSQQRRLFGMLNSTSPIRGVGIESPQIIQPVINHTEGRVETGPGHVEFEIRGDRLYGVLRRYERMRDRT